jgi:HD-GYP domain-containing protein (c-di-GMP phosphodiesterase class II)
MGARAPAEKRIPNHSLSDLLIPLSGALDLAEGRSAGHAQRVAYIAGALGDALGLDRDSQLACYYAALFHDIGVITAGAGLSAYTQGDELSVFSSLPLLTPEEAAVGALDSPDVVIERIIDHVLYGSRAAGELGLPANTVEAIATHHERWDGSGYPYNLIGEEIPVVGRVIGLADQIEGMIDQSGPLLARRNLPFWLNHLAAREADPALVHALRDIGSGDLFWLRLFSLDLARELSVDCGRLREARAMRIFDFSEGMSRLIDARFSFTAGISSLVAQLAESLGRACGFTETRVKLIRVASYLHDIGQLSISERILSKPGILSVEELEYLHLHPLYSRDIVAGIVGLEDVSSWIATHHERVDGRGYPEGRVGEEIPVEARILAVVDAYVAITSDRPYRPRATGEDARRRLLGAAGSQLDPQLVDIFLSEVVEA